jgi:uncharacterized protein
MIEDREFMIHLLDFYSVLLTETQAEVMRLYYEDDLSLTEIAENRHVSRNAVHDMIKTSETALKDYEVKLALYQKWQRRKALIDEINESKNYDKLNELEE